MRTLTHSPTLPLSLSLSFVISAAQLLCLLPTSLLTAQLSHLIPLSARFRAVLETTSTSYVDLRISFDQVGAIYRAQSSRGSAVCASISLCAHNMQKVKMVKCFDQLLTFPPQL